MNEITVAPLPPPIEFALTSRLRHGKLWRVVEKMGSQSAVAKALGVTPAMFCAWVNLTAAPSLALLADLEFSRRFLDVVGCLPEDAFPPEAREKAWLRSRKHQSQFSDALALSADAARQRLEYVDPSDRIDAKEMIRDSLAHLSERERQAVSLRFGLDDGVERTYSEAGKVMGVTMERVRQIEIRAIGKLRGKLREQP